MDCPNLREDALDVLYGEADPETRRRVLAHHEACPACRDEYAALEAVRRRLAAWTVPQKARLDLRPPNRGGRLWPALAAAAGLVLALGAAARLANASFEFHSGPIAFRIGAAARESAELEAVRAELAAQDRRHRAELSALRASFASADARSAPDDSALLSRVDALVRQTELRQNQLLDARLASFAERSDAQRRYDLARISAGLSYLDGKSGQHFARTTELMSYLLQASEQR
jgi:Putative zinc-finger